jgi:hypothetical protein
VEYIVTYSPVYIAGELTKVRVWHDNKFLKASWFLERINLEDQTTKKVYEFPCDRWLGKDKEDGSLLRELACANRDETTDSPVAGIYNIIYNNIAIYTEKCSILEEHGWRFARCLC